MWTGWKLILRDGCGQAGSLSYGEFLWHRVHHDGVTQAQIRDCLLKQVHQRGAGKTICSSEVARVLGGDEWRDLMPLVREVGTALTAEGHIVTLQKGQRVDPSQVRGPIRYGLPDEPI